MPSNPQWYFGDDPALSVKTKDGLVKLMQYVWSLRDQQASQNAAIAAANNSITNLNKTVSVIATTISENNNSSSNASGSVLFGTHANRANASPATYKGWLYVENDRFQATYYSTGGAWILVCGVAVGSFENRYTGLSLTDTGFFWIETSRNNIAATPPYPLYQWQTANWNFQTGEFYRTQSQLTTLANTFNSANSNNGNDIGAIVNVTDFAGQLQWANNNNWVWGPQDCLMHGAGPIPFEADPSPTTGWHLYDGSNNVAYLMSNGSTGNVNLPNLSGNNNNNVAIGNVAFLEFGSSGSGVNAPVAPTFNTTVTNVGVTTTVVTGVASNNNTGYAEVGQPASVVRRAWFRQ